MKKVRIMLATVLVKSLIRLRIADAFRLWEVENIINGFPKEGTEEVMFIVVRGANAMFKKRKGHKINGLRPLP